MLALFECLNDLRIQILKAIWTLYSFLVLIDAGTSSLFGVLRHIMILAELWSISYYSDLLRIYLGHCRSIIGLFDHVKVLRFDKRLVGAIVWMSIIATIWLVRVLSFALIRRIIILILHSTRLGQKFIEQWILTLRLAHIETWSLRWVQRLPYQGDMRTRLHIIPFMGSFVRDIMDEFVAVST